MKDRLWGRLGVWSIFFGYILFKIGFWGFGMRNGGRILEFFLVFKEDNFIFFVEVENYVINYRFEEYLGYWM